MPDVEVLGHSERNERAQNEITKRNLSVPGGRGLIRLLARLLSSLHRLLSRAGIPVRIDE